jgi:glycosyltransferase involved in cell wall biosynthesis
MHKVYAQHPNVEAWILGDGPLREKVKAESQALGIQHLIRFWGYQAEIAPYLAASDLLLVTSDSDGIPAVILEASMMGKPTIASDVGGISDCVLNGETGFLIDPQNEEKMVAAVLRLLHQPQQLAQLGEKARTWSRANFAIDVIGQRYFDFFRHVLAGSQGQLSGALNTAQKFPLRNCHPERQAVAVAE